MNFLHKQDLKQEPIILNNSELKNITINGIYLPYLECKGTNLYRLNALGATFDHANFSDTSLLRAL
jgi:uncharacterized protein YjbI with pentapeptide repeats